MESGDGIVSFSAVVPTTFKREDYKRTKHDAVFSNWQVLIGSNDWEDFKNGKDGVGRYRVHNLPRKSYPGLYELGVSVITNQDQGLRKNLDDNLDEDNVLVTYLGQAENVRSRLQKYGRSGAHLRNNDETTGLFEDVFSKQGSILYRSAQMGSKREAEATEGMLLSTFDYAWNKGSNGERRQLDLLRKLGDREFMSNRKSGIEIKRKLSYGVESDGNDDIDKENFLSSSSTILKASRSRPRQVLERFDKVSDTSVCGVMLKNGGFCDKSPVKRRKRCEEHKGQRICRVSPEKPKPKPQPPCKDSDCDVTICGVILPNMGTCNKSPVPGRKRCQEHKGMRVNAFLFLLNREDRAKTVKDEKPKSDTQGEGSRSGFCEAMTKKGLPCTRSSPQGSKRCWQHKEKTTSPENSQTETVVAAGKQAVVVLACGVKLGNGLTCERSPRKGCKRCAEHKGMRVTTASS